MTHYTLKPALVWEDIKRLCRYKMYVSMLLWVAITLMQWLAEISWFVFMWLMLPFMWIGNVAERLIIATRPNSIIRDLYGAKLASKVQAAKNESIT